MKNFISNIFSYKEQIQYDFTIPKNSNEDNFLENENNDFPIFNDINKNLDFVKVKYNILINSDIQIREFNLIAHR